MNNSDKKIDLEEISKAEFVEYLSFIKDDLLAADKIERLYNIDEIDFEKRVYKGLVAIFSFEQIDYREGSHAFPDITCGKFGIEIKTTEKDSWITTGNSIMESTRTEGVEFIYLFFLKKGGTPDIRIKEYEKCLSDISVTHSPRYQINMEVNDKDTIFSQMGTTYDTFRQSHEKIMLLRKHYKSKGSQAWFMEPDKGEITTPMKIEKFSKLSKRKKKDIQVELYSLFTEVAASDYNGASAYLISKYGIYDRSFRDKFSAGGKARIRIAGQIYIAPRMIENIIELIDRIKAFLEGNKEMLETAWEMKLSDSADYFEKWKRKISIDFGKKHLIQKESDGNIELNELIDLYLSNRQQSH